MSVPWGYNASYKTVTPTTTESWEPLHVLRGADLKRTRNFRLWEMYAQRINYINCLTRAKLVSGLVTFTVIYRTLIYWTKIMSPKAVTTSFLTPVKLFWAWVTYTDINQPRPSIAVLVRTIFCLIITPCSIEHEIFEIRLCCYQ